MKKRSICDENDKLVDDLKEQEKTLKKKHEYVEGKRDSDGGFEQGVS